MIDYVAVEPIVATQVLLLRPYCDADSNNTPISTAILPAHWS